MFKLICLSTFKPICYVRYKEDIPLLDKCNHLYSNIKYKSILFSPYYLLNNYDMLLSKYGLKAVDGYIYKLVDIDYRDNKVILKNSEIFGYTVESNKSLEGLNREIDINYNKCFFIIRKYEVNSILTSWLGLEYKIIEDNDI